MRAVDLMVYMNCEGLLPDRSMLNSLARAHATSAPCSEALNRQISTADIWTIQDWRPLRLPMISGVYSSSTSGNKSSDNGKASTPERKLTLLLRKSAPFPYYGIAGLFQNSQFSSGLPNLSNIVFDDIPQSSTISLNNSISNGKDTFTQRLQWSKLGSKEEYSASNKLGRLMRFSESRLLQVFPGLTIDLSHPQGTACPNRHCRLNWTTDSSSNKRQYRPRPLTLPEVYSGWKAGDANDYTTRCFACHHQFVPRFTVTYNAVVEEATAPVVEEVWCELLSPWTLRKEVYAALFQESVGVESIMTTRYRTSSPQRAVVFWNLLVVCRITGLPYAFLLSEADPVLAFPPSS